MTEGGWSWYAPTEDINGTVITWYLQDNLKWSDGTPLTAYDVNFTYYLTLNHDNSSGKNTGVSTGGTGAIWKIEVVSETIIRIHIAFVDPYVIWHYAITPLPQHIWASHWNDADTWTLGFKTDNDTLIRELTVGSGPFVWDSHSAGQFIKLKANPNYWRIDVDKDGIPNRWEVQYNLNATDPSDANIDVDNDGLTNIQEYQYRTNPLNKDTDSDGMPDGWEITYSLNATNSSDASLDGDSDGLTNFQEYIYGTNPNDKDTDSDGIPDGWEITYGFNATNDNDASSDPDSDGLTNLQEYNYNTNPLNNDTDSDGMPDGWEVTYGLNPTNAVDAYQDPDGDFTANVIEFEKGRNPNVQDTPLSELIKILLLLLGLIIGSLIVPSLVAVKNFGKIQIPMKN